MHIKKEAHIDHHKESSQAKYLKSTIYGGLDGIITTFAVVAGVAGASLSSGIVLILGFANLIADGISMAIGDYLSTKSTNEYHDMKKKKENLEVERYPKMEKDELIKFYLKKGMKKDDALRFVNILSKNKRLWVETLMTEELDINPVLESPLKNSIVTFISFFIFGLIPLLVYVINYFYPNLISNVFIFTIILTALALFGLGLIKVKVTGKNWLRSGVETLIIGGLAAGAAYLVGYLLSGVG